jgi:hypothetical protein
MTKRQIFKLAAMKIANGEERYSCNAVKDIAEMAGDENYTLRHEYQSLMAPTEGGFLLVTHFESGENYLSDEETERIKLHRSLALLFAGEVLK